MCRFVRPQTFACLCFAPAHAHVQAMFCYVHWLTAGCFVSPESCSTGLWVLWAFGLWSLLCVLFGLLAASASRCAASLRAVAVLPFCAWACASQVELLDCQPDLAVIRYSSVVQVAGCALLWTCSSMAGLHCFAKCVFAGWH